jgi:hypothetical protein
MANHGTGQKYYINRTIRGNARMFATQLVRPGDEIIAERPLDRIRTGLQDTYNPTQILDRLKKFNASRHLDINRERMSQEDRDAMDHLFNKDPDGGICSLWATNGMQLEELEDGQTYTSLLLFNDISRANHSCKPNAVYTWNATRQVGTLYDLDTIRSRTEITIEYAANTEDCLRTGTARRKDISKAWNFECKCGACFQLGEGDERRNKDDDKLRSKAARLLKQIESDEVPGDESVAATALRKLDLCDDYLKAVQDIGIKDIKLANAWRKLAKWHEKAFDAATPRTHRADCGMCDGGRDRKKHLGEALDALNEEHGIHIRCWGTAHPDLAEDDARRQALQVKLNRYV